MHKQSNNLSWDEEMQESLILLHQIYPELSRTQLLEAKETLDRYFDLAVRIWLHENNLEGPTRSTTNTTSV